MNKKVRFVRIIAILLITSIFYALFSQLPYILSRPPHLDDSDSTSDGIQTLVNASNHFAFDVYSKMDESEVSNLFYSPFSIFSTMAMIYEGSNGETADEMKSVFYFPESSVLRSNYAAIFNDLTQRNKYYEVRIGNGLWVQNDFPLLDDYIDQVESFYGGKAANLNFYNEPEKSRQTINNILKKQTNNKISDSIPSDGISRDTKIVLANAIYFNGEWLWKFDKSQTSVRDFNISPEITVETPMMNLSYGNADLNYISLDNLQILELPYNQNKFSMILILPKDNLDSIETSLTCEMLMELKTQMQMTTLGYVSLPKFEFELQFSMKEILKALGMPSAFDDEDANLSRMTNENNIYLNDVHHRTYLKVDEVGTEAAGVTSGMITRMGIPDTPLPNFIADHPFIFLIQEKQTGNILFMGRVTNPTQSTP